MTRPPTRNDVAKAAGVSPAVVSYVMNNGPRPVSEAAHQRVTQAVELLGYRPNRLAQALKVNRSNTIGLLLPDATNPFFWELAQALEVECLARGLVLFIGTTSNDEARERKYVHNFEERQVDGLIVVSAGAHWLGADAPPSVPCVLIDRSPEDATALVQSDGEHGGRIGAKHLIEAHDRRRVLLLAGPSSVPSTHDRLRGARAVIEQHPLVECLSPFGDFSLESGYAVASEVISTGWRPDGVFAFSDAQGLGALRALFEFGLAVPTDVSVVGFDGTTLARYVSPSLTSVRQDVPAMARRAIAHLVRLIDKQSKSAASPARPARPRLQLGETCGCRTQLRASQVDGDAQ